MLQRKKLDALFQLLQEMTLCSRETAIPVLVRWMQWIGKWLMAGFITSMVLLVGAVFWYWSRLHRPAHHVPVPTLVTAIYLAGIAFAILYMLTAIVGLMSVIWHQRRERFPALLARVKQDLLGDTDFLARLQTFDKPTLEYGLIQYRHSYGIADGRIALFAGDIRKIGLFPALTTAAMAAATLLKDNINAPFLWTPLILACSFYLVGAVAIGQRERVGQVIALVEYCVGHANELPKTCLGAATQTPQTEDVSAVPTTS